MRRRSRYLLWIGLAATAATAYPAGNPVRGTDLVFPPPPAPARLIHRGQIADLSAFSERTGLFDRLTRWLAGPEEKPRLTLPHGLDAGPDYLLAADPEAGFVHRFALDDSTWSRLPAEGRLLRPVDAAQGEGDTLFISDPGGAQVVACDREGRILFACEGPFVRPAGLAWDHDHGRLLVADAGAHIVLVIDGRGHTIGRIGREGDGEAEFHAPLDVALGLGGEILVLDALNFRVQVLDDRGGYLRAFGEQGDAPGRFSRPRGLSVDGAGRILVTDALQDAFQIFDDHGTLLLAVGGTGRAPGAFWMPAGIAVGPGDRIYVADAYNRRIQLFDIVPENSEEPEGGTDR